MKAPAIRNNERCGACGSRKTFILGKDKRIGKTCGNEDCKLHLAVAIEVQDWIRSKAESARPGEASEPAPDPNPSPTLKGPA